MNREEIMDYNRQTNPNYNLIPIELFQQKYYFKAPCNNSNKAQQTNSTISKYKRKMIFYKKQDQQQQDETNKEEQKTNNESYQLFKLVNPIVKQKDEFKKSNERESKQKVQHISQRDNNYDDLLGSNIITIFSQYSKVGKDQRQQHKKNDKISKLPKIKINESCKLYEQSKDELKIQSKTFQITQQIKFEKLINKVKNVGQERSTNIKLRYKDEDKQQLRTQSLEERKIVNVSVLENYTKTKNQLKSISDENKLAQIINEYEHDIAAQQKQNEKGQQLKLQMVRNNSVDNIYDDVLMDLDRQNQRRMEKLDKKLQRNALVKRTIVNWIHQSKSNSSKLQS